MSLFVLDSDILSLMQKGDSNVISNIASHDPKEIAITVISVDEQLRGWFTLVHRAKKKPQVAFAYGELARSVSSLSKMQILTYSESAIDGFESLNKQKLGIGANDLRIASIVMEHQATVVTRNVRDFQLVPGLMIQDWSK